ncbi:MAG: hypothetical protein WDN28_11960 [Chthoniobacter sp.]
MNATSTLRAEGEFALLGVRAVGNDVALLHVLAFLDESASG